MITVGINNAKQGLTRVPTYAELVKEIDRDKYKTAEIRKVFDRNAWYFHESPLGGAMRDNVSSNIHPADLQQQNFKNMASSSVKAEEETEFYDIGDEMEEAREEGLSDIDMMLDRERDMREENERSVSEQVNLSHSHDHYLANRGTYDSISARPSTQSFSAGIPAQSSGSYYSGSFIPHRGEEEQTASAGIIEDEEPKQSVLRSLASHSKPIIKKVAQVVGKAKGGDIGGMVAEKLADYIIPDGNTKSKTTVKKSITKEAPKPHTTPKGNKKPTVSMDVDVQENPEMLNPKVKRPSSTDRRTKVKIQKPDTTRPTPEKRTTEEEEEKKTKKGRRKENTKALPAVNVSSANAPASSSTDIPQPQSEEDTKTTKKKGVKHDNIDKTPSETISMQVMLNTITEERNRHNIDHSDFDEFKKVANKWKTTRRDNQEKKKELLNEAREIYKKIEKNK